MPFRYIISTINTYESNVGKTRETSKLFWNSIPKSVIHIISGTPRPISFIINLDGLHDIFDRREKRRIERDMEKFVAHHADNLKSWSFNRFPNTKMARAALKLLRCCTSVEVRSLGDFPGPEGWDTEGWEQVLPVASHISMGGMKDQNFWSQQGERDDLSSIYCQEPSPLSLQNMLGMAPNLSCFAYRLDFRRDPECDRMWGALQTHAPFLQHVVAFVPQVLWCPSLTHDLATGDCVPDWTSEEHGSDQNSDSEDQEGDRGLATRMVEKSSQEIYKGMEGLLDKNRFPKLQDINLVLNPFPDYPRQDIRNLISLSIKDAFSDFQEARINVIVLWGKS